MNILVEEFLPFCAYYKYRSKLLNDADNTYSESGTDNDTLSSCRTLDQDTINTRIEEEHERAKYIDEKTVKFTLTTTIALTLLSSTSPFLLQKVTQGVFLSISISLSGISVLYLLIGGLISLEALRTMPTYGYSTDFRVKAKGYQDIVYNALAAQEKVNAVRQVRNEAAFQCIRNGLLLLMISFSVTLIGFFF